MGCLKDQHFFQYSYTRRTPSESSQLGEPVYAISVGKDVRLKNNTFQSGKFNESCRASIRRHGLTGMMCEQVCWGENWCKVVLLFHADTTATLLESCRLGEQKYTFSGGHCLKALIYLRWKNRAAIGLLRDGQSFIDAAKSTNRTELQCGQLAELKEAI